jgi:hypothetical protein
VRHAAGRFENLIELGDALLDLFDLPFALLDKLFLKVHLGVGDLGQIVGEQQSMIGASRSGEGSRLITADF